MSIPQVKFLRMSDGEYSPEVKFERVNIITRYLLTGKHSQNDHWVSSKYQPIDALDKTKETLLEVLNHEVGVFCLHYYSVR